MHVQSRIYNGTSHILILYSPLMDKLKILTILKHQKHVWWWIFSF